MKKGIAVDSVSYSVHDKKTFLRIWAGGREWEELASPSPYGFSTVSAKAMLRENPLVEAIYDTSYKLFNTDDQAIKFQCAIPEHVAEVRMWLEQRGMPVAEADIPYIRRMMLDNNIICSNYEKLAHIDIEVDDKNGFPEKENPIKEVTDISLTIDGMTYHKNGSEGDMFPWMFNTLDGHGVFLVGGWNSSDFDYPYLCNRMVYLAKTENPIFWDYRARMKRYRWVDLLPAFKIFTGSRQGGLDVVMSKEPFFEVKPFARRHMYDLKPEQRKERNMWDSTSTYKIDKEVNLSDVLILIAKESHIFPDQVLTINREKNKNVATPSTAIDSLILKKSRELGYVLPCKKENPKHKYEGAFVALPKSGKYSHICQLDYSSLYPSIILTWKLSPDREKRLLPEIVEYLMKYKNNAPTLTQRTAFKILLNSLYGILASRFFRLYNPGLSEEIARHGREIIRKSIEIIKEHGFEFIYSDTDSLFFSLDGFGLSEKEMPDAVEKVCKIVNDGIAEYIGNQGLQSRVNLAVDAYWSTILFPRGIGKKDIKKRYAGLISWTKKGGWLVDAQGNPKPKAKVVGLEAIRGDWCNAAKTVQHKLIFDYVLQDKEEDGYDYLANIKSDLFEGKLDDELILRRGLPRKFEEYAVKTQHIKAAEKGMSVGNITKEEIMNEHQVVFVYTRLGPEAISTLTDSIKKRLDYDAYWEKQIKPIAQRLGFEMNTRLDGQNTLDLF